MPRFEYKVRDQKNRIVTGSIEGVSVDDVIDKLDEKSLAPLSIEELNFDGSKKSQTFMEKVMIGFERQKNKVRYREVVFFTRQLATMLEGGVPLSRSLEQLARAERPVFKKIITQIAEDISMGHTFSDAIARHPGAFNNMFVSVVHSGEISGSLNEVLDQMATYMENVEAMKSKVKAAMRYPMFIAGFITLLIIGILWKLVPMFENIYGSFGAKLPAPTQILIACSHFVREQFPWIALALIILAFAFRAGLTNDKFRLFVDTHILKFPVFGGILRKNTLAVFCRTMALLMESGTPILQAVEIGAAVVNSKLYSRSLEEVYAHLRQGELLSAALEQTGHFPPLITQLVSTGEESGRVDVLLRKAAEFYEREIRNVVDSLAAIIEPFLIIILGGIVGLILIALYFPIFMIGKLIGT
jgi:type IV pilus assembly protein PilC